MYAEYAYLVSCMPALCVSDLFLVRLVQVGVQCEVDAEAGASFLEDKVNSVLPLQDKEGSDDGEGSK